MNPLEEHKAVGARTTYSERISEAAPALSVKGISKSFGRVAALRDISLDVMPGEARAICGENGAGKSTLVKILTGVYRPDEGKMAVAGEPCVITTPRQAQERGIAFVSQELSLCPSLSVEDNIWLGSVHVPFLHKRADLRQKARGSLALLNAGHIELSAPVSELTMGDRQIVEIARMLVREARVLILDEPTATLSDIEIEKIFSALLAIKREGRSIIYITHRLSEVFRICDTVTVLRNGQLIDTCEVAKTDRSSLIEMMLGRSFVEMYPKSFRPEGEAALILEDLTIPGKIDRFTMHAPKGKIVCVAGQVGSGAEDVVDAIAGLTYNATGRMVVGGKVVPMGSVSRALDNNVMFISGDRAEEGIFRRLTVQANLVATRLGQFSNYGLLRLGALRAESASLAERVGVDRRRLGSAADELSGGNQQKLAIGRCIGRAQSGVLVMKEPTRGIDVGARSDIYRLLGEFCDQGYALVMTSSDLEEIVGLGDIVITMYRGRQVGWYLRDEVTMHRIVADITHPVDAAA